MDWIVSRDLNDSSGNKVTVSLAQPQPNGPEEWACPYCIKSVSIEGVSTDDAQYAYGVDGLQALLLALDAIYRALAKSPNPLTWSGGELGDTGIPRFAPMGWGLPFRQHVEQMLDNEVRFYVADGLRRAGKK